jgi:succinate dehydrogenase / fumarate reductase flavoprotein subunit
VALAWPPPLAGVPLPLALLEAGGILASVRGERFMRRYDADRLERATPGLVWAAIAAELAAGRGTVLLDPALRPVEIASAPSA